ncbi:hypothetical protein ACFC0D_07235 [Streptomyces sp. NPDC056222]|uniref:BclA C-terminal domain-containing protein n=1 Tax=Streptomyces sp. NPDC056222 TaxID=3345749 RepID=UPI0035E10035
MGASIYGTIGDFALSNTLKTIEFNSANYVTGMTFDPTSSTLTVNTPGRYLLTGSIQIRFTPTPGAIRQLSIQVNGNTVALDEQSAAVNAGPTQDVSKVVQLDAGDVITVHVFQDTGTPATLTSVGPALAPHFEAELLEP